MNDNTSYTGLAYIYDALTDDVEYNKRCDYLVKLFDLHTEKRPQLVADLGCGTGTMCSCLTKRGYDCIGIDSSDMMLDVASKKTDISKILYLNQDITDFELYGTVDVFLCMLDTVNYLINDGDLEKLFSLVKNYLNPGGIFVFDVNTRYKFENVLSDNTYVYEHKNIFYTWENFFDGEYADYRLNFFVENKGSYNRFTEEHTQRFYSSEYLSKRISDSGLLLEAVYGDMSFSSPDEKEERIIFVVKKAQ